MNAAANLAPLILVIEDEPPMRRFLRSLLGGAKFRVEDAGTGEQGLQLAAHRRPDVIILDLGLPDMDGQEVIVKLRDWLKTPIIVLSGRTQDSQKIEALTRGADDYVTKPFSSGELLARIQVALRHAAGAQSGGESPVFELGELKADLVARRIVVRGAEIHLTRIEYKLLTTLVRHAGKVLTHAYLLEEVWGKQHVQKTQHLRVFMAGLRHKIEADPAQPRYILTEQGVGYRLACE